MRSHFTATLWAATITLLSGSLTACKAGCPKGTVLVGSNCQLENSIIADGGVDAGSMLGGANTGGARAGAGAASAPNGGAGARATAGGAGGSKPPPIDPMVEWMCMKNSAGMCTSCRQDGDCPKHVCEQGFCMDCREASQCNPDESCISNRCVPERKPSGVWTTSGGGATSATGLKMQLSVGTPAPAGSAAASGYKLSLAPGAGLF